MHRITGPRVALLAFVIVFGVVVGVGILTAEDESATPVSPGSTTTTTVSTIWVSPQETRIGPAVVVPIGLESTDTGELELSYDIISIAPERDAELFEDVPAAPTRFTLVTASGARVTAAPTGYGARVVSFDVPQGTGAAEIRSIAIGAYEVGVPIDIPVAVPLTGAAWHSAGPGIRVRLVRLLEQSENVLVVVEIDTDQDVHAAVAVDGIGRDWVSASGSMMGSANWTLDFRGDELPDPLPLVVRGMVWTELEAELDIELGGVAR